MAASIAEEKLPIESPGISETKFKYTNKSFVKKKDDVYQTKKDLKIFVGNAAKASFLAHKAVLRDVHDFFADSCYKEGEEGSEVYFNDVTTYGFSPIFEYFYHGSFTIDSELFPEILEAALFFKIEWILDVCRHFMQNYLGVIKYPATIELAERFGLYEIKEEICKSFGTFLTKLAKGEAAFKDYPYELISDFLQGNYYTEMSEFLILQFIIKWLNVSKTKREDKLLPLLNHVKFNTMTPDHLQNIPKDILDQSGVRNKVEDARAYWSDVPRQCLQEGNEYLNRGWTEVVIVSAFHDGSDRSESNILGYKDPNKDEPTLSVEELGPSGLKADYTTMNQASIGNFLFAAGGYGKEGTSLSCVYMFDARTKKWTDVASMIEARASFAMCSSKNRLYVIGGVCKSEKEEEVLSTVEMYIPEENKWKAITSLESSSFNQSAIYYNNALYVTGGINDVEPVSDTICLQDGSSKWTTLPDMSARRQGHSMAEFGGKLYVLGGYTSKYNSEGLVTDCFVNEIFDLKTKQWTVITSTPKKFGHLFRHTAIIQNKVHFLCNIDSNAYLNSYDMECNEFTTGVLIGKGVHKVGMLQVAFSPTCLVTPLL